MVYLAGYPVELLVSNVGQGDYYNGREFRCTSTATSYVQPLHLTITARGGGGGCCMRKREHDKTERNIGNKKPEQMSSFGRCIFTHQSLTNLTAVTAPRHPKSTPA